MEISRHPFSMKKNVSERICPRFHLSLSLSISHAEATSFHAVAKKLYASIRYFDLKHLRI